MRRLPALARRVEAPIGTLPKLARRRWPAPGPRRPAAARRRRPDARAGTLINVDTDIDIDINSNGSQEPS